MTNNKKLAVVTGASSGIGRASALRLAEAGYDLFLVARRRPELEELSREIANRYSTTIAVQVHTQDMALAGAASLTLSVLDSGVFAGRSISMLINNAGFNKFGAIIEQTETDWHQMIDLNCMAVVSMCKEGALRMRDGGVIVNVASLAADLPLPYMAVYSATKAFVTNFSCAFGEEVRRRGIRVVSVNPGAVRTDFVIKAGMPGRVNRDNDMLLVSADYVAKKIMKAIRCPRAVVVPVRSGYFLHALMYVLPRPLKAYLAGFSYRKYL